MDDLFDRCAAFTSQAEGGYCDEREDAGNWSEGAIGCGNLVGSNMGISAPVLIAWNAIGPDAAGQVAAMRGLDRTTFEAIARSRYWRGLGCDGLPPAIALMSFDYGFNAGVSRAGRLLQSLLGMDRVDIDGDVGPKTQAWAGRPAWQAILPALEPSDIERLQTACRAVPDGRPGPASLSAFARRPELWPAALATAMFHRQVASYRGFAGFASFGSGWIARAERRRDLALSLACAF